LLVTEDGTHAFALRETLHYGAGRGLSFRLINLMDINPFLGEFGKEEYSGYCQYAIDINQRQASLSLNNDTIIKVDRKRNNGLASAMLSLAISLAEEAGMKKITVYNVIDPLARPLYIKLGFSPIDATTMAIDLEHKPEANPDGTGCWQMKEVAKQRKFRFFDFSGKENAKSLENSHDDIQERLLNNDLIQAFFKLEENKPLGRPFFPIIKDLISKKESIVREVIDEIETMGEDQIEAEGREILDDFNNMPVNKMEKKVHTWTEFVEKPTIGEYDLTQIFAHNINIALNWLQLLKSKGSEELINRAEKGFKDNFREGYIVLKAIEIEANKNSHQNQDELFSIDTFLPDVMLEKLEEIQASLQADLFGTELENKDISLLDNATDINSRYAYSVSCGNNTKIILMAKELWDSDQVTFFTPDTYYVSIVQNGEIIGYGALENYLAPKGTVTMSFRIFNEYRHQKDLSKKIFKTLMASAREVFGSDIEKFLLMFHQINNPKGIDSAAVLFYLKIGFEIRDKKALDFWLNVCKPKLEKGQRLSKEEIEKISSTNLLFSIDRIPENSLEADLISAPSFEIYSQAAALINQSI